MALKILLAATVSWPSTARLAGAFASVGARVAALAPSNAPVMVSRYTQTRCIYRALAPIASFGSAIAAEAPDLIIPCDDRAVEILLELQNDVPELLTRSFGDFSSYPSLMTRNAFLAAARNLGIATPLTVAVHDLRALRDAAGGCGFPLVVKADGSWGGDGVAIVRNHEESEAAFLRLSNPPSPLRSLARAVRRGDPHHIREAFTAKAHAITVQSFVEGHPATTAFASWNGSLLGAIHADVLMAQNGNGPATVIRRVECDEMTRAAKEVAEHFRLSGLHGLDFMRDRAGKVHLLEVNPRATQLSALSFERAPDLIAALMGAAGQKSLRRRHGIEGDVVALFPQEWRRDPASPYLESAHHDVPWDDPALIAACTSPRKRPLVDRLLSRGRNPDAAFTTWKPSKP